MTKFSEKYNFSPKIVLDKQDVPETLKNRIWNILYSAFFQNIGEFDQYDYSYRESRANDFYTNEFNSLSVDLRHNFFKLPIDSRPIDPNEERQELRRLYFRTDFPKFYNLLEYLAENYYLYDGEGDWIIACNNIFVDEGVQFRFVCKKITPVLDPQEMEEIEKATKDSGVDHINQALDLYAKRPEPDYRNSIKESLSAVEATYRKFTGKAHRNIGDAISEMENMGINLPPILKEAFSKIYGWGSDGRSGIRHALMEEFTNVGEAEARLILVMCSAYVNYLKSLQSMLRTRQG